MTIEQYLKSQLGELQFALAATMAERDALKARLDQAEKAVIGDKPVSASETK